MRRGRWAAATVLVTSAVAACSFVVDLDRPLRMPDGGVTGCERDSQCDDGQPCTELVCREGECVLAPEGDQRDLDGDGFTSTACGGDDCDDGDPSVHPEASESCDGRDEDCDGQVDDGAYAVSSGVALSLDTCTAPALDSSETAASLVCEIEDEACTELDPAAVRCLALARLSHGGDLLGQTLVAPIYTSGSSEPALVSSLSEQGYGLVWIDRGRMWFAFLDADAEFVPADLFPLVTGEANEPATPAVAWTGSRFALVWSVLGGDGARDLRLAQVQQSGSTTSLDGEIARLEVGGEATEPTIAAVEGTVVVAFTHTVDGRSSIDLALWDGGDPTPLGLDHGEGTSRSPDLLAIDGETVALAYRDIPEGQRAGEVFLALASLRGLETTFSEPRRLSSATGESDEPRLSLTRGAEAELGVIWQDERTGDREVLFARVGLTGEVIARELLVSREGSRADRPVLAPGHEGEHLVAYHVRADAIDSVVSATLGCR